MSGYGARREGLPVRMVAGFCGRAVEMGHSEVVPQRTAPRWVGQSNLFYRCQLSPEKSGEKVRFNMKNPITEEVKDALYESASYDWDFDEEGDEILVLSYERKDVERIADLFNVDFDALNNYWRTFLGLEG